MSFVSKVVLLAVCAQGFSSGPVLRTHRLNLLVAQAQSETKQDVELHPSLVDELVGISVLCVSVCMRARLCIGAPACA